MNTTKQKRLTRENNLDCDRTIVYVYDKGGNITQKTSYAYMLGDITSETEIKNKAVYVYSDPVRKDKLTSFEYTDYEDSDNSFSSAMAYIFEKSSRPVKFLGANDPMIICKVDRNSRRSLHELLGRFEPIEKICPRISVFTEEDGFGLPRFRTKE